jgi:hypothetical protein
VEFCLAGDGAQRDWMKFYIGEPCATFCKNALGLWVRFETVDQRIGETPAAGDQGFTVVCADIHDDLLRRRLELHEQCEVGPVVVPEVLFRSQIIPEG